MVEYVTKASSDCAAVHLHTKGISCDQLHLATTILYLCILAAFLAVSYNALYLLTQISDILY